MKALNCNFQHTTEVSSRRRALFPKDDNNPSSDNSDLDCIKSLSSDSESDNDDLIVNEKDRQFHSHIGDYDIIGIVDDDNEIISKPSCTPQNTKLNTDLSSSSSSSLLTTKIDSKELIEDTPSQRFNKTPQDSLNHTQLPKLTRKSSCNNTVGDVNKLPLIEKSPIDNTENLTKNPKVRTALFRELDMSLSTCSFYPKNNNTSPLNHSRLINKSLLNRKLSTTSTVKHQKTLYLCNRSYRRKIGIINAGVRHGIRKPKKLKRIQDNKAILKAALNIIENSPLNEYLNNNSNTRELIEDQTIDEQVFIDKEIEDEENQIPEEIDTNRRFFKSSKRRGIVTVSDNIRIEMNNGKMSLINNVRRTLKRPRLQNNNDNNVVAKRPKSNIDFEIDNNNETLINPNEIDNLIKILDDKERDKTANNNNNNNNNRNVEDDADLIMSPTSQMCNMTLGLALNSPKKAKNLLPVLNNLPSTSLTCNNEQKLYPVFYPRKMQNDKRYELSSPKNNNVKKFRQLSKDQMLLDAGQKRFGVTQCTECKFIYHMGDASDEIIHLNYHESRHIFRFTSWKNERIVSNELLDGKILQIVPNDPKVWWKKIKDLLEFVNRDLGFYDMTLNVIEHSQIFLYVKNKTIIGVLVAEVKTEGYRLLTTHTEQIDLCSEESYPIKCGISRIWVAANYRKKGIGTALMDSLKRNFAYGYILKNDEIAFSSPTESGKVFAKSYFKTPNFLIYM